MHEIFSDVMFQSKLNQKMSRVLELTPGNYSAMDIFAYKCLPKMRSDNLPH